MGGVFVAQMGWAVVSCCFLGDMLKKKTLVSIGAPFPVTTCPHVLVSLKPYLYRPASLQAVRCRYSNHSAFAQHTEDGSELIVLLSCKQT